MIDVDHLPELSFGTYCMFLFFVFMVTGFMLLLYCFMVGVNPFFVEGVLGSPFLWLGLGFIMFFGFIYCKVTGFTG